MMSPPERVHIVIEAADGLRLARVPMPPWVLAVLLASFGLGLVSAGALFGDYLALARQRVAFAAVEDRLGRQQGVIDTQRFTIDDQQVLLDGFEARLRQLRAEVDGWRELQARIWQPFGPDAGPPVAETGVGGTAIRHLEPAPQSSSLKEEMERVASVVLETGQNLRALDQLMSRASRVLAMLPARWPVRGPANSEFGVRSSPWSPAAEFHSGLDIGARVGTSVLAPAAGIVTFAGPQGDYGLTLIIDHGNDIRSLYAHLSRLEVEVDQKVEPGTVVAHTGNTGRSSGPHLHYEIQLQGRAVNPRTFLWN
jgi:murein DD-endopeptidase MepM/ murein hydrolase activator NlpD